MKKIFSLIILLVIFTNFAFATNITLFYGEGCPHCANAISFIEKIESDYSNLSFTKHEVYFNETGRNLLLNKSEERGVTVSGVPTIFLDNEVLVGFDDSVRQNILKALNNEKVDAEKNGFSEKLTIPAVVSAAIVDAINPCAFAVLIILLSTILVSNKKKKALFSGLAFSLSIFISYFLMGIGLYSAISAAGLSHIFYFVISIFAIILGFLNLKDYFWYGKWFIVEVPVSWRPKLKTIIRGVTSVPGAFLVGFLVSLFLLPCTSGPYIVILGLLSKVATRNYALLLLVLYNIIFILPMILITLAVYFGLTNTKKAEEVRQKKLKILHLIAGLIILALGFIMLFSIGFGFF